MPEKAEGLEREAAGFTVEHVDVAQVVPIALDQARRRDERDEPAVGAETSGSPRQRHAVAFPLNDRLERYGSGDLALCLPAICVARDLLLHQKACLDRPAGLERRVVALPDDAVPVLGLKMDAIELLEDVLHLVGDEPRHLRRHPKVDVRTDQCAGIEGESGAGIGARGRPGLILGKDPDPDRRRRADSGKLAPKRRRTLSHALDHRLEQQIHVKIRR